MKTKFTSTALTLLALSTLNSAKRRAGSSRRSQAKAEAWRRLINPKPFDAMKTGIIAICYLLSAIFELASAQGTAFTYQGRLNDGAGPASGMYDLRFTIYDSPGGGLIVGGPLTNNPTGVSNGLFTATINFGPGIFNGGSNWLEIAVRTNGTGSFAALSPRQPLTPGPYVVFDRGANAAGLSGTISSVTTACAGREWREQTTHSI